MYAIGGSADPTIFSEGNYFVASDDPSKKQVSSFKIVNILITIITIPHINNAMKSYMHIYDSIYLGDKKNR